MTKKKKRIKRPPSPDHTPSPKTQYPSFSFRYLNPEYGIDQCDDQDRKNLLNHLLILSQLTWNQIYSSGRHGLGTEKIKKRSDIKAQLPPHITEDTPIIAMRFGNNKPMIGYRKRDVFYILFLDAKFNVYPHGKS